MGFLENSLEASQDPKCVCDSAVISESEVKISVSDSEGEIRFKPVITQ